MTTRRYRQAKRVFEAAIERDSETWPSFLDEACGPDTALREQVESLLREHKQADSFLDEPVWRRRRKAQAAAAGAGGLPPTGGPLSPSREGTGEADPTAGKSVRGEREGLETGGVSAVFRSAFLQLKSASGLLWNRSGAGAGGGALRPPLESPTEGDKTSPRKSSADRRHWGHLEILEKLGEGGFGTVYRAWDPTLEREVALKLIASVMTPPSGLGSSKFHEARMLARIRHPNVVVVHGVSSHSGRVGLWMEFIRGRTLEEILREQVP